MDIGNSITIHNHVFGIVRDNDGVEHVTLTALCEPFGLKVDGQRSRMAATSWGTLHKIWSRRSDGKNTAFWSLPLRRVPMFFATLSPGHVDPDRRAALEEKP